MAGEGGTESEEAIVCSALGCPHCRGARARPGGGAGPEDGGARGPAAHPARAPARAAPRRRPLLSRQPRLSPRALGLPRAPGDQREAVPGPAGAALPGRHLPVPAPQRPGARGAAPRVPRPRRALAPGGRRAGGLQTASAAGREGLRRDCCVQCLFINK